MSLEGYSEIWLLEKLSDGGGWVGGWFLLELRIGRANQFQECVHVLMYTLRGFCSRLVVE